VSRALCIAVLALVACGGPPAVSLDPGWPEQPRAYGQATAAWTRHEALRHHFIVLIDVHATYKAPEWRAAFVERQSKALDLSADARAALESEQKQAAATAHEFVVALTAFDNTGQSLHDRDDSPWDLVLVDDRGRTFEPLSVDRERGNDEVVRTLYPYIDEFDSVYVVRFPPEAALLGGDRFTLRLASARGRVDLTWRDQT
jgi:hypothetical protein